MMINLFFFADIYSFKTIPLKIIGCIIIFLYNFFLFSALNLRFYQALKEVSPSFITFLYSLISIENTSIAFIVKYFNTTLIIVQITNFSNFSNKKLSIKLSFIFCNIIFFLQLSFRYTICIFN